MDGFVPTDGINFWSAPYVTEPLHWVQIDLLDSMRVAKVKVQSRRDAVLERFEAIEMRVGDTNAEWELDGQLMPITYNEACGRNSLARLCRYIRS